MAAAFGLSPAEMRIAELVVAGRRPSEIASELHLSTNTVRVHLKRIFRKVGVHTQAQLAIASLNRPAASAQVPPLSAYVL
jgi:DNA-binding CsgD family transcriptional regulator